MPSNPRGALIIIEGLDRAGKSTQCERLCQRLKEHNHQVKRLRFPDRSTPIGRSIDAYLKGEAQQEDHVIHLLFSANRWEAAAQMRADVERGTTLVVDRYYYSGIVYSAAKDRKDLSLGWARAPDVGLPRPDLCVFLDVTPEAAAERGGFGSEKYETGRMQARVRELFYELLRGPDGRDICVVDAGRSLDEVEGEVWTLAEGVFRDERMGEPLGMIQPWDGDIADEI